jgi:PAS domain S-box-containing protein
MGKYLSTDELNRLAKTAQLSLAIHRSDDPQLPPDFAAAKTNLLPGTQSYIQPLNDDIVAGYTLVNDIYGQPALLLRTDSSRDMYKEGKASQNYFMIWIAALGLFSCIIIYIVLDRLVLSRLQERATEVKRKQAEDLYRTLFEQSGDAVFLLDLEGQHVEVNQRATEMLGYSYDELLKLSLKDISAEQSQSKDILSRLLSGEVISTYERIFRKKDGGLIDVEPHITLLRDETGQPFHIQSIVRDISERKRAEAEIRTRTNELSTLYDLSRALANANDLDKVLGLVNRHTVENIRITFACIALLEDGNLATRSVYPIRVLDHDLLINSTRPITAMPFCQSVLEQDQPVILRSSEQSISGEERDHLPLDFAQTLCLIPLRIHDFASNSSRMLGLLMVGESRKEEREPFTPAKIRLVRSIGDQAAIAINNVRLFNDLQRSNVDLSQAYTATISGWAAALELRDKETEGHAQRVTEMTFRLAKQMGFSEQELVQIRYGALLHDIGKMGVPDRILLKPDTLTDEERGIMCMHPTYAYQMLKPITYLGCALNIPYCHHEKWDGTGYPRGLIGEQIPIEAQLFAVVDVYDALTSDRPYRKSWPHEKTLEHIQGLSGSHFCPQVVDEFIKLLNKVE